jgi:hypothetical protein
MASEYLLQSAGDDHVRNGRNGLPVYALASQPDLQTDYSTSWQTTRVGGPESVILVLTVVVVPGLSRLSFP